MIDVTALGEILIDFTPCDKSEAGCIISYDPNYRAPLWDSKEAAIEGMKNITDEYWIAA